MLKIYLVGPTVFDAQTNERLAYTSFTLWENGVATLRAGGTTVQCQVVAGPTVRVCGAKIERTSGEFEIKDTVRVSEYDVVGLPVPIRTHVVSRQYDRLMLSHMLDQSLLRQVVADMVLDAHRPAVLSLLRNWTPPA